MQLTNPDDGVSGPRYESSFRDNLMNGLFPDGG